MYIYQSHKNNKTIWLLYLGFYTITNWYRKEISCYNCTMHTMYAKTAIQTVKITLKAKSNKTKDENKMLFWIMMNFNETQVVLAGHKSLFIHICGLYNVRFFKWYAKRKDSFVLYAVCTLEMLVCAFICSVFFVLVRLSFVTMARFLLVCISLYSLNYCWGICWQFYL